VDQSGKTVSQDSPRVCSNIVTEGGVTPDQIAKVRKGMWNVVNAEGGTASRAANPKMVTAGKTGTAQFWRSGKKDNHTWFISFAPFDNPEYVVVVFVQGAKSGGGVSRPSPPKSSRESANTKAARRMCSLPRSSRPKAISYSPRA
jgi:penicillin-binding protein 2